MVRSRTVLLAGAVAGAAVARRRAAARAAAATPAPAVVVPAAEPEGRERTVTTRDGVALSVREHGPAGAEQTVVLVHGYTLSDRCWHHQVRGLLAARPDVRVLTYDHRGHGRSGATPRERATIAQLGEDLGVLLDELAPRGGVVLAGHSMGGMTVMALAEERPELFGDRVRAVALVSTSSGRLAELDYGLPRPAAALVRRVLPAVHARNAAREAAGKPVRAVSASWLVFGPGADPQDVRLAEEVMAATTHRAVADFSTTFHDHDRVAALAALSGVPVTVLVGDLDKLCPLAHSEAIADALPHAKLAVMSGAGHMLPLERSYAVTTELLALLDQPAGEPTVPVQAPQPAAADR